MLNSSLTENRSVHLKIKVQETIFFCLISLFNWVCNRIRQTGMLPFFILFYSNLQLSVLQLRSVYSLVGVFYFKLNFPLKPFFTISHFMKVGLISMTICNRKVKERYEISKHLSTESMLDNK